MSFHNGIETAPQPLLSPPSPKMSNQKDGQKPDAQTDKEWLRRLLETKLGGFRNAAWQRCKSCDEITIRGMDADLCAGMVTVDAAALTPQQEYFCAMQGRRTYVLDIDPDRKIKINDRIRYDLAKPERRGRPIVAEHVCGHRYPGFIEELRRPTQTASESEPPF